MKLSVLVALWCAAMVVVVAKPPNIVFFLTDDQDYALGGWTPMKQATRVLNNEGATAVNWFIHTPVCCPSRAEFLSGRYFHNVRETVPKGGCMHVDESKVNPLNFAHYLGEAGYTVGYFGKYLNQCPKAPQPGFDCPTCYWFANGGGRDSEPGGYLNATFHDQNGTYHANTNGEFAGYTTSIVGNKSIEWVQKVAHAGKPFMVTVAPKAPHVPSTPAPWYKEGTFIDDLKAPRTPNYNASHELLKDHHWLIAQQGPITTEQGKEIDELFRNRWRTLLSVDDAIVAMVDAIDKLGLLDSTYFFSSSDHGFNLGQHRLPSCKLNVYDHDIRIPFVARGPGIPKGVNFTLPASNVDLAPTFLGLAGVQIPSTMDGKSVVPHLVNADDPLVAEETKQHIRQAGNAPWREYHFVEYYSLGNVTRYQHLVDDSNSNTYRALRFTTGKHGNMLYSEFTAVHDWDFKAVNFYELFNLDKDPYQLTNLYSTAPKPLLKELHELVAKEWACKGAECA